LSAATRFRLDQEIIDRQPALDSPESWARDDDPPAMHQDLPRALAGTQPQPPIRDPVAIAAHREAGRLLSLEQAVAEALAVQVDAPPSSLVSH
ncbi:hypothetical protein OVW19_27860, partial [Klebsiella pneumoniae]|uniref:hypothetical protein n=1 Tax=Klebsiella pneumoniae TaxID=573 RepID=UPI00226FEB63